MKCFNYHKKFNRTCEKTSCRYWISSSECNNCCIVGSSRKENFTLQDVGKIFNVTRMRICQIEKIAINKLKDKILSSIER
jgi:hypothetical protein